MNEPTSYVIGDESAATSGRLRPAVVLLSGGLDSTAALHWALEGRAEVRAIGFDYGQPSRDHELAAADACCRRRGVAFVRLALADTIATRRGLLGSVPDHASARAAPHGAFVPGRNAVFLAVAAAHAAAWWPDAFDLAIGATADDAAGFPDCRAAFFDAMAATLRAALARDVAVVAPWRDVTKVDLVGRAGHAAVIEDIAASWSCYRREGPCGTCTPCVLRRAAFVAHGIVDRCAPARLIGGEERLR